MPKSKVRQKTAYTPPPRRSPKKRSSPPWVGGLMAALFLIGVVWLVVFYVTGANIPGMSALGNWNLAVGFAFIVAGFGVSTQWR